MVALGIWLGFPNAIAVMPPFVLLWPLGLVLTGQLAVSMRSALFHGWLATMAGMFCALYWLCYPVHDVGGLPWPAACLCALAICACMAIQGGIFCVLAWIARDYSIWRRALFLALCWYLLEYGFALAAGFPWLPLSAALAVWPVLIQAADITGAYFLSAIWIAGILLCTGQPPAPSARQVDFSHLVCGLAVFALISLYGVWRLERVPVDDWPEGPDSMGAVFIEGNVEQNQKWLPEFQKSTLDLYIRLTNAGVDAARIEGMDQPLIIWPETAMPFFFETRPSLAQKVRQLARDMGCPLLFGAPGVERLPDLPEGAVFNRAFLLAPDGYTLGHYDKEHLVPFGEYLPSWLDLPFLSALVQGVGIYQEGSATAPLRYDGMALGMLICYEGIFPWLAQKRVEAGANILVDISNDGWFRNSPAARQHLYLTIPRCVEQNRWLLRSTNTGISAVCDTRGRVVMAGPQFQAGFLLARGALLNEKSFYHKISHWMPFCALTVALCLFIWRGKKQFLRMP